jgi:chaperonin cofactor prefoldin
MSNILALLETKVNEIGKLNTSVSNLSTQRDNLESEMQEVYTDASQKIATLKDQVVDLNRQN